VRSMDGLDDVVGRTYRYEDGEFDAGDDGAVRDLVQHIESSRILCISRVRRRLAGEVSVNAWFHDRASSRTPGRARRWVPGEPVMAIANDYDRGLWNGDQGVVLDVTRGGRPFRAAVFPRGSGFVVYPVDALGGRIRHSFAITVHKSQGSEYDRVAVVFPDDRMRLLTREILYTAMTRARTGVVLVGRRDIIEHTAAEALDRFSGIESRLRG